MGENFVFLRLNSVTHPMYKEERQLIAEVGGTLIETEGATDEDIIEHARGVDALLVCASKLNKNVIDQLDHVRVISRFGTGVDKIDLDAATAKGIVITNLPGFSTNEVADHAMALLLAVARKIKYYDAIIRTGHRPEGVDGIRRLAAMTLGIIGLGSIGRAVALRAQAFGMNVIGYDPVVPAETVRSLGIEPVDFDTVLAQSDYLSLHCPLLPETRGLIGLNELKRMKRTAVLINTARGDILKEIEVCEGLRQGLIQFAAIDVFGGFDICAEGGFPTTHPWFSLDNVILTPHVASNSEEAIMTCRVDGTKSAIAVLTGGKPNNVVNKAVLKRIAE